MNRARKLTLPPWMRPNAARAVKQPSWITKPRAQESVAPPSGRAHLSLVPPAPREPTAPPPPSTPRARSVAPPKLSLVPPLPDPRIAELEQSLAALAADLATYRKRVLEESEPDLVRLALTIAERIVAREITADPQLIVEWTREATEALGAKHAVVVAVSADLANAIDGAIVDPALPSGSCEVRDGARAIEVGARARMQAMTDALSEPE